MKGSITLAEEIVMTQSSEATASLFGAFDANVKIIEKAFNVIFFFKTFTFFN